MKPRVHFFGGQGIGWALDEDLDCARRALHKDVMECGFAGAPLIHSAWWPPLAKAGAAALRGKTVMCFADNPPALYLTQPGFESAAALVDLWIARSKEALEQFRELGLKAAFAPYVVDEKTFHPLEDSERERVRSALGLKPGDFVVGNFHRDSLERDVNLPKAQKGPDIFLQVVRQAKKHLPDLKVLLAGPRRHWLRRALAREGIPFVFAGEETATDDFSINVLPRERLNELYAALDAVVISSRWEGGPYAVLEGLFAERPVISTRVGMAADLLDGWIFETPDEAVGMLRKISSGDFDFREKILSAREGHSLEALRKALLDVYPALPSLSPIAAGISLLSMSLSRLGLKRNGPVHAGIAAKMDRVRRGIQDGTRVVSGAIAIREANSQMS